MKKLLTISILILAVAGCLCLSACGDEPNRFAEEKVPTTVQSYKNSYATTALSSGILLEELNAAEISGSIPDATPETPTTPEVTPETPTTPEVTPETPTTPEVTPETPTTPEVTPEIPTNPEDNKGGQGSQGGSNEPSTEVLAVINRYIGIAENLLTDSGVRVIESVSDRAGYSTMLTASAKGLDGVESKFILYYNESAQTVDSDGESKSVLRGIMVFNGAEYAVYGERETEDGESELEFTASIDRLNYVKIKQETDRNEEEFGYEIVVNGVLVSAFELEISRENNETEVEVRELRDGSVTEIKYELTTYGGKKCIEAECVENGIRTKFKVFVTVDANGKEVYRYEYKTGAVYDMKRIWND